MEKHSPHSKPWYAPLIHFLAHTVVGSLIFLIILIPAVLMGLLVHKLQQYQVNPFTVLVLELLEHVIFVLDSVLFLVHLGFTFYSAVRSYSDDK